MHQMRTGPDPGLAAEFQAEIGDALDRHQPAIGDAAGELRRFSTEQDRSYRGMDAVGADQHVGAMDRNMWRPVKLFALRVERRLLQGAAIVPAPLMRADRAYALAQQPL